MTSKGKHEMGKTVITRQLQIGDKFKIPGNPSQTYEVVDIKGDYLIYRNVRSHEEFQMVRGFATKVDLVEESATYQKKRFKEPYYMYNESAKTIKEAQERKKDYLAIVKRFRQDINKHIDKVERDIERGFAIDYSDRDEAQVLGTRFSAELLRYNLAVENKVLTEGFIISDTSTNNKPVYFRYGKYTGYDWGFDKNAATKFSTKEAAERMIEKMRQEGMLINSMKVVSEGRIAKGYENLDADEKARHLLSHPSSKYMNDLKSENITERAIRKAVKEMLGKPDKRDPQFIIDVNEGCGKVEESVYYIKSPSGFYVMKTDNSYDLTDDKEKALKYTISNDAAKELSYIHKYSPDSRFKKLMIVQEEGEAPAASTTTANVANPELPLKLKEGENSWEMGNGDKIEVKSDIVIRTTKDGEKFMMPRKEWETGDSSNHEPNWRKMKESVGQKLNISLVRKAQNLKEVEKAMRKGEADRVKAVVDKTYKLSADEYDKFVYNFMAHTTYLNGEGGVDSDDTVHVIEITAPGKKTIYVDPEGYDYARYVGF